MRAWPSDWRANPYTIERPSPVPCPIGLVVKKGSKARALTAAGGDKFEPDLLADAPAQQVLHRGDELIDVDRLGIERLAAREGEKAMRQRRGTVRRGLGHRRV